MADDSGNVFFDSQCRISEPSKNLTPVQTVFRQKLLCNLLFKLSDKITLLAFNVQIKNVLKQNQKQVYHRDFRTQLHYFLVVVIVSVQTVQYVTCKLTR